MVKPCFNINTKLKGRVEAYMGKNMPEYEAGLKVIIEEHKKLHDELNDFKKSISADPKKFKSSEYIFPDTSSKVKEITDRYNNIIKNTKIPKDELIISEDKAENDASIAKLTEEDNIEQEPNVEAIERQAENADRIGSKEIIAGIDKANEEINAAIEVVNVPISEIKTNEQEYQGRKNKFSERSARKVAEQFDKNKLQPIVVYKHPDGNTYVLSGHSRLEGMKRRKASTIPATYFEGTPEAAKEFAKTSNKQGDLQTDIENAAYYREKLLAGESYNTLLKEAKENEQEGSAKRIVSLAHLNPNGKAMQALEALDKGEGDSKTNILNIATKIGDIRAKNDHLTDAHENELFEFMAADKKNIPTDKDLANQNNTLNRSINMVRYTPEDPLNLDKIVNKSENRKEWERELRELTEQQNELKEAVNPSKKTGWTGLKEKAIRSLIKGENTVEAIDKAVLAFENNENGVKDAYQAQLETKRGELASVNDKLAKHLLREKDLIKGDKAQQSLFSIQSPTSQAISDMRDIVKDYVDEGTNTVEQIQNDIAKELGDNSQEMKDLVEKAYNEFYNTKESTPIEVTGAVINKVGKFLSRLFGGTAASKVFIAKDEKAIIKKFNEVANGKGVKFQISMPDGSKKTVQSVDVDVVNGFYSPLEKTINEFKGDKLPAKQWADKFKGEEAKWTGLTDWLLKEPNINHAIEGKFENGKWQGRIISKADIQNFLKENRIEVVEVVKGTKDPNSTVKSKEEKLEDIRNKLRSKGYDLEYEMGGEWVLVEKGKSMEDYEDDDNTLDTLFDTAPQEVQELATEHYEISENDDDTAAGDTKYSGYQRPGEKTNYKEVLITMPTKSKREVEGWEKSSDVAIKMKGANDIYIIKGGQDYILSIDGEDVSYHQTQEEAKSEAEKRFNKKTLGISKNEFKSNHWAEPNILAHVRMNTRVDADGKKVLFLEEIQSDWGEIGRKKGFAMPNEKLKAEKVDGYWVVRADNGRFITNITNGAETAADAIKEAERRIKADSFGIEKGIVPAPFVTDTNAWTKLALKVALKEAVKQGADKIAWTTGEQQNARYDLSKQVDEIVVLPQYGGSKMTYAVQGIKSGTISATHSASSIGELEGIIGKELAKKVADKGEFEGELSFTGNDLKVGGKGMKGFYGSPTEGSLGIVGNVAKSLFKQEPKTVKIDTGEGTGYDAVKYDGTQNISVVPGNDYIKKGDWLIKDPQGNLIYSLESENLPTKQQALSEFYIDSDGADEHIEAGKGLQTQNSIDITPELKAQVEAGLPMFMKNPQGQILGFATPDGRIFLNGEMINVNTPIHESSHLVLSLWANVAKQASGNVRNYVNDNAKELADNDKKLNKLEVICP